MDRVIAPLQRMGANITAEGPDQTPPLRIRGGSLRGIRYQMPVPSAQVKSAILLAGLFAKGKTAIVEETQTRDHTERMLRYFFVRTTRDENGTIAIFGDQVPESRDFRIPGDLSSATYWLTAAAAQPGGHLLVRELGLNTTRTPVLGVLVRMGAQVREAIEDVDQLEPRGIVEITGAMLKGTVIQGKEVAQLIDELPVLAVAGALANGTTIIRQAQELRVKESDRIAVLVENLRRMGAKVEELPDGLRVAGRSAGRLHGAEIEPHGDHRMAMAFAIAALGAEGETVIGAAECAAVSYPEFFPTLERLVER